MLGVETAIIVGGLRKFGGFFLMKLVIDEVKFVKDSPRIC